MTTDLILGTAGHIDHGKTALVKALTGVDTDRLPEEKRRGITIELGFAELVLGQYRLGIVDVPGHERFVRNMLAGATGIDLALLVVAADDSVKPQTREHLEILRLLDLEAGVIALTKCDLAAPDWIDLVEAEVRELVAGTFLADAPLVRTSIPRQTGLEELRAALAAAAARAAQSPRTRRIAGPFRIPIDRAFTVAGYGTVVTGSVASGRTKLGDELVLEPGTVAVRVRGLQSHDRPVEEVHRGQRAAINLAGIHHEAIGRGQELASPGHLAPAKLLTVRLGLLRSAPRPLKNRSRVRIHVGTAELLASVLLLDRDQLAPGDQAAAQLFLNQPAVTTWRQPFVMRSQSPVFTIGGGHVLEPQASKHRRNEARLLQQLDRLESNEPIERASAAVFLAGWRDWQPGDLARTAGIDDAAAVCQSLVQRGEMREIAVSPTRTLRIHRLVWDDVCGRLETTLEKLHAQNPLQAMLDRANLESRFEYLGPKTLLAAVLEAMNAAGRIRLSQRGIALASHGPQLSKNEQALLEQIVDTYRQAGFQPPTVEEVKAQASKNQAAVGQLIALAVSEGRLVQIAAGLYLEEGSEHSLREILAAGLAGGKGMTLSEIREALGTSRKFAVPFCEYLDRIGFTRRQGDVRVLAQPGTSP